MKTSVTPFLMFEGKAEEAMQLYVSTVPESAVIDVKRYGPEGPGPDGSIMIARFSLAGLPVFCSDSFVKHAFTFTPSNSLFVTCASEAELDRIAATLAQDGGWLMPPDNYGFQPKIRLAQRPVWRVLAAELGINTRSHCLTRRYIVSRGAFLICGTHTSTSPQGAFFNPKASIHWEIGL